MTSKEQKTKSLTGKPMAIKTNEIFGMAGSKAFLKPPGGLNEDFSIGSARNTSVSSNAA